MAFSSLSCLAPAFAAQDRGLMSLLKEESVLRLWETQIHIIYISRQMAGEDNMAVAQKYRVPKSPSLVKGNIFPKHGVFFVFFLTHGHIAI